MPDVGIEKLSSEFNRWQELLALITRAFASMDGAIDPPSSARLLTAESLREKAASEVCFVALKGDRPAGCIFAAERGDALYVGKLAVDPDMQRVGIGHALMQAVEDLALRMGKQALELQTRIELDGNHAAFGRMGFVAVGWTAHPGFDRPTSITFRKRLA